MKQKVSGCLLAAVLWLATAWHLPAQGTAIFYQGRLNDSGAPANTNYDLRFAIFNAPTGSTNISVWLTNTAVPVSNGLFSVTLDFGPGIFNGTSNGSNDWLDISVRLTGTTNFTSLTPRQAILPVPYALFATSASNLLGTLIATQLVGALASSSISGTYSNAVNFSNSTNSFSGNGAGLTSLNASQVISGTLADARLSANVALLNTNQTFTGTNTFNNTGIYNGSNTFNGPGTYNGANTFSNWNNSFTGSFFGNGLVGWVQVNGISQQAVRDHGYMLTSPSLTTVTLPPTAGLTNGDIVRVSGAGAGGWMVTENSGQSILGNFATYRNSFVLAGSAGIDWRHLDCSSDATRMYAGGNVANGVYYSTDLGHSWSPTSIVGNGFAVACSANGNVVFAVPTGVSGGPVQLSYSGGQVFTNIPSSSSTWNNIACTSDGTKFIASQGGSAEVAFWNNGSLFVVTTGGPQNYSAVGCSGDGSNFVAAINGGSLLTSTSGGSLWGFVASPGSCTSFAAAATGQKLVAAYTGGIATSTNFGASWTVTAAPAANWNCLAASGDCNQIVAGVSNGLLYASANFGASWTPLTSTNQFWSSVCMSADGTKFAASASTVGGVSGGIYYGGTSVQPSTATTTTSGSIFGGQGSAVELQYLGNGLFMPVSSAGILWAN